MLYRRKRRFRLVQQVNSFIANSCLHNFKIGFSMRKCLHIFAIVLPHPAERVVHAFTHLIDDRIIHHTFQFTEVTGDFPVFIFYRIYKIAEILSPEKKAFIGLPLPFYFHMGLQYPCHFKAGMILNKTAYQRNIQFKSQAFKQSGFAAAIISNKNCHSITQYNIPCKFYRIDIIGEWGLSFPY